MSADAGRAQGTGVVAAVAGVAALGVLHALGVAVSLGQPERLRVVHDLAGWAGSLVGLLGTLAAARAFSPGDYQRRVWGAFALAAGLLVVGTALRSHWTHTSPHLPFTDSPLLAPRMVVVSAANVVATFALVLLVRTYRQSGLELPATWGARALMALGAAVALAIVVPQVRSDVQRAGLGGAELLSAVTSLFSTVGDFTTLVLVVPVLRVAYAMRGGRLAWAWWAVGLSGATWLLYDVREPLSQWVGGAGGAPDALELLRVTRSLGLSLMGLAGWLQAAAVQAPAAAPAPVAVRPA
jgi:hypothetical protein